MTETGLLAAGDRIMLSDHRRVLGWAGRGNHTQGWLLGSLVGDGTFITDKPRPMAALGFWGEGRTLVADRAEARLRALGAGKKLWRGDDEARRRIRISSEALAELAARFGVVHGHKTLTDQIEQGGYGFCRGFCRASLTPTAVCRATGTRASACGWPSLIWNCCGAPSGCSRAWAS